MSKAYYRVSEFKEEVLANRKKNFERGFEIGFHSAYNFLNFKKGFTSYLFAAPFSGKTSLIYDIFIYIASRYNAKIALYSPESGGKDSLVSYLVQVYLAKKLHGKEKQEATEQEWLEALDFIDKHFIILDPVVVGKDAVNFDTQEMFRQLKEACSKYKWKLDLLFIDPHTMLRKSEEDRKKSIADYILDNLYYINSVAKEWNMHICISMHTSDTDTIVDKETGIEFLPKPYPSRISNGQNVFRCGQTMFSLWRCPAGVHEKSTGYPYPENATDITICKNKILGAGDVGQFRLYYNPEKQKFYEIINGNKYYCGEYDKYMKQLQESNGKLANVKVSANWKVTEVDITPDPKAALQPNKEFEKSIF